MGEDPEVALPDGPHHPPRELAAAAVALAAPPPGVGGHLRDPRVGTAVLGGSVLRRVLVDARRLVVGGAQHRHADRGAVEIAREALGHRDHRVLRHHVALHRRRVGGRGVAAAGAVALEAQRADHAAERRGVHHVALATGGEHAGHEGLDAVEHAVQVDVEHPVPTRVVGLEVGARCADPRVVHQHVGAPELGVDPISERGHRLPLGDVDRHRDGIAAVRDDAGGHGLGGVEPVVGDDDGHAFACEPFGDGLPDPAARTGDDRDLAPELFHRGSLSDPTNAKLGVSRAHPAVRRVRRARVQRAGLTSNARGSPAGTASTWRLVPVRGSR